MKQTLTSLLAISFILTACDSMRDNRISTYVNSPQKVTVHVDEAKIYVVQDGYGEYVAWGGPKLKETNYASYRQSRAIEIASKCRVDKVLSKKPGEVLRASVNC